VLYMTTTASIRIIANRPATDECQAGTPGCCIDHSAELRRSAVQQSDCETW
jgi:hypothetical protein